MFDSLIQSPFLLRSLAVGLTVAVLCSVLSVYVVLRRMAFIGQGIGHAAFGGIALGLWLFPAAIFEIDWRVYLVAVAFCLANALAIGFIARCSELSEDTAIGILFVVSMALGAVFFKLNPMAVSDLFSYLFGSVLAVTWRDARLTLALAVVVLGLIAWFFKELQLICFDEEMGRVAGIPTGALHNLLLLLLSLTVVVAVKIVGIVLVSAALVLPGATARLVSRSFGGLMAAAVGFGLLATGAGLLITNWVDVPAGASVVLTQSLVFAAVWKLRR
jgi:zinc transport system permease protein